MKIINPTTQTLKVQIKGTVYEVGPEGSISGVPAEYAEYWKNMIHAFIKVEEEGSKPVVAQEVVPEEVVTETTEEVIETKSKKSKK